MNGITEKFKQEYSELCKKYNRYVDLPSYIADYVVIRIPKNPVTLDRHIAEVGEE